MVPIEITAEALHHIHSTILDRSKRFKGAVHPSIVWASSFAAETAVSFVTLALSREPFTGNDWLLSNGHKTSIYNSLPRDRFEPTQKYCVSLSEGRLVIRMERD